MARKKWVIIMGFWICLALVNVSPAYAEDTQQSIKHEAVFKLNDKIAWINGKKTVLQAPPTMLNNHTLVPLRSIGDAFGARLKRESKSDKMTISYEGATIEFAIGQAKALVNGQAVVLEQPAVVLKGTTMVSLKFIATHLELDWHYNRTTKEIRLASKIIKASEAMEEEAGKEVLDIKKRLDKLTVDYLSANYINLPALEKIRFYPFGTVSIAAVKDNQAYILSKDPSKGYMIQKYDPNSAEKYTVIAVIDQRFNFEYSVKGKYKASFVYGEVVPKRLVYDEATDRLYMLVESSSRIPDKLRFAVFSITPEVSMITYQLDNSSYFKIEDAFFASMDGSTYYFGEPHAKIIYSATKGQASELFNSSPTSDKTQLVSIVTEGNLYVYDKKDGTIFKWTGNNLVKHVKVAIQADSIVYATASFGSFYLLDEHHVVHRVSPDGKMETYAELAKVSFNPGIVGVPETANWPLFGDEKLKLDRYTVQMSVDSNGNLLLFDDGILKRVNVYANETVK